MKVGDHNVKEKLNQNYKECRELMFKRKVDNEMKIRFEIEVKNKFENRDCQNEHVGELKGI